MKISIVTPSYNQGAFLEGTIVSVLGQNYPNLEYIVIDGGSADNSLETIKAYDEQLTYWCSEPDQGQYDAINKGFAKSTGEIMAWLNSDDLYTPDVFKTVAEIFSEHPEIEWLTSVTSLTLNDNDSTITKGRTKGFTKGAFFRGRNGGVPAFHSHFVIQESTFWRRSLWEKAGGRIDTSLKLAGDFELWARFWQHANLYSTTVPLGIVRRHDAQKTATYLDEYFEEARQVLNRYNAPIPSAFEIGCLNKAEKVCRYLLNTQGKVPFKAGLLLRDLLRKKMAHPYTAPHLAWDAWFVDYDRESKQWNTRSEAIL